MLFQFRQTQKWFGAVGLTVLGLAGSLPAPAQPTPLTAFTTQTQPADPSVVRSDHVEARLIAEAQAIVPGEPFMAAVRLTMADKWHTYFKNPGASGERTQIDWTLPAGFSAGAIQWPAPERYNFSGFVNYVYHGEVVLPVQITPPADLEPGSEFTLTAMVHWLECADVCIPAYDKTLKLTLNVAQDGRLVPDPAARDSIQATLAALPQPAADRLETSYFKEADRLVLLVQPKEGADLPAFEELYLFATQTEGTTGPAPFEPTFTQEFKKLADGTAYTLSFPINPVFSEIPEHLEGYLQTQPGLAADAKDMAYVFIEAKQITVEEGQALLASMPADSATEADGSGDAEGGRSSILFLLGAAFLGGLVLNLMPCVFPVLGVKVLSFVKQAGEDRSRIFQHGLIFTAGVLVSFWLLALAIVLLKSGVLTFIDIDATGWGGWLQIPEFVLLLAIVVFLFSLNLSSVFEVGQSIAGRSQGLLGKSGAAGTFLSGMLAVAVGTPCAAPFLAPALTAVFTMNAFWIFVLLTAMGVGLALPYLILSAFPGWVKLLPKPGAWMQHFKQVMAFPLYGTAGYLVWVFAGQAEALTLWVIVGFTSIALGAYLFGAFGSSRKATVALGGNFAAALLVLGPIAGLLWSLSDAQSDQQREVELATYDARALALQTERDNVLRDIAQRVLKTGDVMYVQTDMLQQLRAIDAELAKLDKQRRDLRSERDAIVWEAWSPQRQAELLAEGKTVYVDFTARWCVTCQTNKFVYADPAVIELFRKHEVVALKADWTNRDPLIAAELARFDRKAIPFNVIYGAGLEAPVTLPGLLTPGAVIAGLKDATFATKQGTEAIALSR